MEELTNEAAELAEFGYAQTLKRRMGPVSSFGVAFSAVSITGTVVLTLPYILSTSGTVGLWTLFGSTLGGLALALVFSDLVGRMPLAGYGYQWASRLANLTLGWFVAAGGIVAFFLGTSLGFYGFAPFFLSAVDIPATRASEIIAGVVLLLLVVGINMVGIRFTARLNNVAVITEIVGGVGVSIVLLVTAIIYHPHPFSWLVQAYPGHSGSLFLPVILGFYYGAFMFVAWEAAADLAEETINAPRTAARAMLWTIVIVAAGGIVMSFSYAYASPSIKGMIAAPAPLLYVLRYQWGGTASAIVNIAFLVSFFSVLMITTAAAARLVFSLARDGMLPGARLLERVNERSGAPLGALTVVGVLMLAFTVLPPLILSSNVIGYFLSASGFGYHVVYILVVIAYLVRAHRRTFPNPLPGAITMQRFGKTIAWAALVYEVFVLGVISLPHASRDGAVTAVAIFVVAGIWYLIALHGKVSRREVGPPGYRRVAEGPSNGLELPHIGSAPTEGS